MHTFYNILFALLIFFTNIKFMIQFSIHIIDIENLSFCF